MIETEVYKREPNKALVPHSIKNVVFDFQTSCLTIRLIFKIFI